MKIEVSKNNENVIEKIRKDKEICDFVKSKNLMIVAVSILGISFTIDNLFDVFNSETASTLDKITEVAWVVLLLIYLIEAVVTILKLKNTK